MTERNTSHVLGVDVARITTQEFIAELCRWAEEDRSARSRFVTYLNAACSNIVADDADYAAVLKSADVVYADGQSIVWAAGLMDKALPERVNAGDFIESACGKFRDNGLRIGLIGGRPGVAEKAAEAWKAAAPGLVVPICLEGFFEDDNSVVGRIAEANVDILLVGMSAPVQEKFSWRNRDKLNAKVIWCVGALFEYYGEGRPRAPVWMRRIGMEWLFRLALEPGRLWRRYLVGNVRFMFRVLRGKFGS